MSIQILPNSLAGITFEGTKTPVFSSVVKTSRNGKEQRRANWPFPKWEFKLKYEFIREAVNSEFQTLVGFVMSQLGQANTFYYHDQYDDTATGQAIGVGDNNTKAFRLVRTLGSFVDLIYYAPTISAVYIDGVQQTSGWSATASGAYGNDTITFETAPQTGQVVTADFTFYYVCRFKTDSFNFDQIWYRFWKLDELNFTTVF